MKLRNLVAFQEGYVNPSQTVPEYFGDDVKWLRAVDLNDSFVWETSRRLSRAGFESAGKAALLFEPGSLAISKSGTIGRIGILKDYMCGNRAVINIRVDDSKCDNRFIFYSLLQRRGMIEELAAGSVQRNLYCSALGELEIDLPSLAEQRVISAALGALDDKIELNRSMNATLEAMAQALFQSWFVDFDPVRAKLDGQPPVGLAPAIAALFPARFQDSPLGPIPEGWHVDEIRNQASNIQYGFTQSAVQEPIGPHFLRITDIRGGGIDWASVPFCEADDQERQKYRIMDGDIFVARTGASTGENIYIVEPPPSVFASYLIRIQFASRGVGRVVGEFMRTADYANHIAGIIGGSAQPNASAQTLAAATMVFPPTEVAETYYRAVRPLDLMRAANDRESRTLAALRDTLLPKLLSGELRVGSRPKAVTALDKL